MTDPLLRKCKCRRRGFSLDTRVTSWMVSAERTKHRRQKPWGDLVNQRVGLKTQTLVRLKAWIHPQWTAVWVAGLCETRRSFYPGFLVGVSSLCNTSSWGPWPPSPSCWCRASAAWCPSQTCLAPLSAALAACFYCEAPADRSGCQPHWAHQQEGVTRQDHKLIYGGNETMWVPQDTTVRPQSGYATINVKVQQCVITSKLSPKLSLCQTEKWMNEKENKYIMKNKRWEQRKERNRKIKTNLLFKNYSTHWSFRRIFTCLQSDRREQCTQPWDELGKKQGRKEGKQVTRC